MPAIAEAPVGSAARPALKLRLDPTALFWICATIVYGAIAAHAATGHFLDQTARDIWQHLAALKALIADPIHPANPFIPTHDPSRHFNPYWVGIAVLARALGWNEWQAYAFASFLSAGVLLAGVYNFGRAFYRDPWGPLALLAAMTLFWIVPNGHTGYHSPGTLIEGIAYPAALLIGLSLNLWALVIHSLDRPRLALAIVPLAALMFATHQLGAVIGFITAASLILLWPEATPKPRMCVAAAVGLGIVASTAWPYMNPLTAMLRAGNSTWPGPVNFYSKLYLFGAFVPQIIGLIGLRHPDFRRVALPILLSFGVFMGLFALGLFGVLIATRFLMPAVLMLHIGIGALLIAIGRGWREYSKRRQLILFALAAILLDAYAGCSWIFLRSEAAAARQEGSNYASALALTRDIPDMQPVAAYDVAAWPVVATGQRALSEPWPEPGIPDLAIRQAATDQLFDSALTMQQRVALAKRWGVRTLIMHDHGAMRRPTPPHLIETLRQQSIRRRQSGPFLRFDLY